MRNNFYLLPLLLGATAFFYGCETEVTSCQDAVECEALGDLVEVCCTDDGTDMSCQYNTSDGQTFTCDAYPSDDELGESCDDAAADLAEYCKAE